MTLLENRVIHIILTTCAAILGCEKQSPSPLNSSAPKDAIQAAWENLPAITDPERRSVPLPSASEDQRLDASGYVGFPAGYREAVVQYITTIDEELGAERLTRKRFYNFTGKRQHQPFPDGSTSVFDRQVSVLLTVLPRPEVVSKWSASTAGKEAGWLLPESGITKLDSVYGRTILFQPGKLSEEPFLYPATPLGESVVFADCYLPGLGTSNPYYIPLQKIVAQPTVSGRAMEMDGPDASRKLHLREPNGAVLLGEMTTVPLFVGNSRLRLVKVEINSEIRTLISYALIDGNGAKRAPWLVDYGFGLVSPYMRPLKCDLHQPRLIQHDLLLMPTPLPWPPESARTDDHPAHEEWCLDDWFPAQKDAVWVIRETALSTPLKERFELMPGSRESDLPVFFVAVFAETEPQRLVQELASLHGVSPDRALRSEDTMQKLEALYRSVMTFPLDK